MAGKSSDFMGSGLFFPGCKEPSACVVHTNALSLCELRGVALCGGGVEWSPVFRIMIRFSRRANKESRFCGVCG